MRKTFRNQIDRNWTLKNIKVKKSHKSQVKKLILCLDEFCAEKSYNEFFRNLWLFTRVNARMNRLHERALRVIVKDFDSSFEELLRRGSSTTFHQWNLQKLMTEIFKVKTWIAPELMKGVLNLLIYLIIWGISLNVAIEYHVLKCMALKGHLL